jgi:multicomponent Na+:H+ antiporter subunit D
VTLNLISSALFLAACAVCYGALGTLNLADLALVLRGGGGGALAGVLAALLVVAFGLKAAMFPLFGWLPASYHTPPVDVTALFSALLTKVGVYALIRVFTLLFPASEGLRELLLVLAALTMVTGVLGAVAQTDARRLLSFHIVSQIGYLLMGLGLFTRGALAGAVFFRVHVIVSKSALFLAAGVARRLLGSFDLARSGGLAAARPLLAGLFLLPALSLAGLPPLSGFFAKLALVDAGLAAGRFGLVAVSLAVSLLTLFSMTKLWAEVFWKPAPGGVAPAPPGLALQLAPLAVLAAAALALGLAAGPAFALAERAADQLLSPAAYLEAVLAEDLACCS